MFGDISGLQSSEIQNINIDGINIDAKGGIEYVGGFAGSINSAIIKNIALNGIGIISGSNRYTLSNVGGFVGRVTNSFIDNITLNGNGNGIIKGVGSGSHGIGGFGGMINSTNFTNISLKNIASIIGGNSERGEGYVGGFGGMISGKFESIVLNNIEVIEGNDIATRVYERHRVLTRIFENLGVSHETAENDACRVEHFISEETFEALKEHAKKYGEL